jgi:hypothetical protein
MTAAMVAPSSDGQPLLPKRAAPKGLLPSTWLNRSLRIEYVGADGRAAKAGGTLLDWYPAGIVLALHGTKVLVSWDRVCLIELEAG